MFRKNKVDKAKLEHKLYLARENPEPIFDLSDCGINNVPTGVYSLCRVFRKESLHLEHNSITSLSGGGNLKDLHLLTILDLHDNAFSSIPEEIELLSNLLELYINGNRLKKLPESLCNLTKLRVLDVSDNSLKNLPDNIGKLNKLQKLNLINNKSINSLPKSISNAQRLREIELDASNFVYPPSDIASKDVESILRFICDDVGVEYVPNSVEDELPSSSKDEDTTDYSDDHFKEQRLQDFMEIEKNNEVLQRQEFELAMASKANREKLLTDLSEQQARVDLELAKVQHLKDSERFKLIEQLQEIEQNADRAINQLLSLNKEPLEKLLELEKIEEERLLISVTKYNDTLRKTEVLNAMQELLEQETERFKLHRQIRRDTARSVLEQEMQLDTHLTDILQQRDVKKDELLAQLLEDEELQKTMVGALLERGDSRSWGLIQQVRMVELQLGALTAIELDRKKLMMDEHLSDLEEKRCYLSKLLVDLLHQQGERRAQLLSTLRTMEEKNTMTDFWLRQYQQLLDRTPTALTEAQKNMDLDLCQALLMCGALHCAPFLAHLAQTEENVLNITEDDIRDAGVIHSEDRYKILEAFHIYSNSRKLIPNKDKASAPLLEELGSSSQKSPSTPNAGECVICLDFTSEIIFVPCGHMCCCGDCSDPIQNCPMCRAKIGSKIRVYSS